MTSKLLHAEQKKLKALERELNAHLAFKTIGQVSIEKKKKITKPPSYHFILINFFNDKLLFLLSYMNIFWNINLV